MRAVLHPHYAAVIEFGVRNFGALESTTRFSFALSFLCYRTLSEIFF